MIGDLYRLALFFREGVVVGRAFKNRFGVDPAGLPCVKGGDDQAGVVAVQQGDGKALVPSDVLERVEPDDSDLSQSLVGQVMELVRNIEQVLYLAIHFLYGLGMVDYHRFEALDVFP